MTRSDAQLLLASRADSGAFRELYDRYAERVHGYHLRRSRDREAALDLTAETFAQAWLCRARFRDEAGGSAGPWLFAIARNVLFVSVRKRRLELDACTRLGVLQRLDREPSQAVPEPEWLEGLDEALADLPDEQRDAVTQRVVDDLTYSEIATHSAITDQTARARVSRGLRTLRHRLSDSQEMTP